MLPLVIVRPIHFASNMAAAEKRLRALGLICIEGVMNPGVAGEKNADWLVFEAPAGGRVAIHRADTGSERDGVTQLGFEVANMEALKALADIFNENPGTAQATLADTNDGPTLQITAKDGLKFAVNIAVTQLSDREPAQGVEVAQMWFTDDVAAARDILLKLGHTELVTTKRFGWDDTRATGGGRTQLHEGACQPRVSVGFMSAIPLEELQPQAEKAGEEAAIVDEAWGRYLALPPISNTETKTGLDGELTWVNEEQSDYYGYQVIQDPTSR